MHLKQINQQSKTFGLDEAASIGLHILLGKHKYPISFVSQTPAKIFLMSQGNQYIQIHFGKSN